MKIKKVGIITFHCSDNYGAVLQSFALMDIIEKMNIEAEFINFSPIGLVNSYRIFPDIKYTLKKTGLIITIKMCIKRIIGYKHNKIKIANFTKFRQDYLKINKHEFLDETDLISNPPKYDYYITGSDQVWNPDFFVETGGAYFLNFVEKDRRKISYAPSIAKEPEHIHLEYYEKYLSKFDFVSVREKSSKTFVSQYTDKEVTVTLDPTLLVSSERWKEIATSSIKEKRYILVYDLIKDSKIIEVANRVSENYGYKIISYSSGKGYKKWYRSFSNSNPTEFIGLFSNAEFIVTNSFHGTAFSVIFNKPFYTIAHHARGSRMIDLLEELGLESRIIKDTDDIKEIDENMGYNEVNLKLESLRQESIAFLKKALQVKF